MTALDDLIEIAVDVSGCAPEDIDVDAPLQMTGLSDRELELVLNRLAERHRVALSQICAPDRLEDTSLSSSAINGLRDLAVFFPTAKARLDWYSHSFPVETFRSWAQSVEEGYFIGAKLRQQDHIPPANAGWVVFKYGAPLVLAYMVPAYLQRRSCAPLCSGAFDHNASDMVWLYPLGAVAFLVFCVVQLGPAIIDIRRSKKDGF